MGAKRSYRLIDGLIISTTQIEVEFALAFYSIFDLFR